MKKLCDLVAGWTPERWHDLLSQHLPASILTDAFWRGKAGPCPVCGGRDRFCYDNRNGRGDWFCRKCAGGSPMAGDGLALVQRYTGLSYSDLHHQLSGHTDIAVIMAEQPHDHLQPDRLARRPSNMAARLRRVQRQFSQASPLVAGDHAMQYLGARVPGLSVPPPTALRLVRQSYWHEGKRIGTFPTIIAAYTLPDGRLATVHRTTLDPTVPRKACIRSPSGDLLPVKRNDVSALPLDGGAVRLMDPVDGKLGVAEGIETAYAAYMLFGIATWPCLNRVQLAKFDVPPDLGVREVHIFADFDEVDASGRSPGIVDALILQRRLRAAGYGTRLHRPRRRGTDFCDEWSLRQRS